MHFERVGPEKTLEVRVRETTEFRQRLKSRIDEITTLLEGPGLTVDESVGARKILAILEEEVVRCDQYLAKLTAD